MASLLHSTGSMGVRLKVLLALLALLVAGGVIEYVVVLNVHRYYGIESYGDPLKERQQLTSNYDVLSKPKSSSREAALRQRQHLQKLGKSGVSAAKQHLSQLLGQGADLVSGSHRESAFAADEFYHQRDSLLERMEGLFHPVVKTDPHFGGQKKPEEGFMMQWKQSEERRKEEEEEEEEDGGQSWLDYLHRQRDLDFKKQLIPEVLVEKDASLVRRNLTPFQAAGNNVMLTLRTTKAAHNKRLPLLFSTWLTKINRSNVFLMTDGRDAVWQNKVWKKGVLYKEVLY